ncbi:MAG: helix-turn-helix domain-containing protein [Prevotellaceae bacterium]|jgi:AraC-like DNA-binding protein|nr:helix-turn-helix domain-containing protein [Prevotellaceae bacterium]
MNKSKSRFCVTLTILLLCFGIKAQENPFVQMANQSFADYICVLEQIAYQDIELHDSTYARLLAAQMRNAAKLSNNKKWQLEADYFELLYHFSRTKGGEGVDPNQPQIIDYLNNLKEIIKQAQTIDAKDIELRALYDLFACYFFFLQDFKTGFGYGNELDLALTTVSDEAFPLKPFFYAQIALCYYTFGDYPAAKFFFEKVTENSSIAYEYGVLETAWYHLGLINRLQENDLQKSDFNFYQTLFLVVAILFLFGLLFYLYHKNRFLTRQLIVKALEWAKAPIPLLSPSDGDAKLFAQLQQLMADQKVYRNQSATLEYVAKRMNVHGMFLSQAVTNCVGGNFKAYLNQCRIREAIRLMANPSSKRVSIKAMAEEVGFENRKTFSRFFTQFTGLSPSRFLRN